MSSLKQPWLGKNDYFFILVLALTGLVAWLVSRYAFPDARTFVVKTSKNGTETLQFVELDSDKTIKIQGKAGEMLLEFSREKGVRVASSNCPCQVCVNSGWSRAEALICVPNGVIVQPKLNEKNTEQADAVTR